MIDATTRNLDRRPDPLDVESALDSLDDSLIGLDRQWRYVYLNGAAEKFFGQPRAELLGRCIWELHPDAAESPLQQSLERALQEEVLVEVDTVFPPHSGWYSVRACPLEDGLWVRIRNVTQHRTTNLRRLARVFSDSADPILILDLAGHVLGMNDEAERAFRRKQEDTIGDPMTVLIPPERHKETEELLARCRSGERIQNIETLRLRADGEVFPVVTSVSLVTDDAGNPSAITTIAKDVSELERTRRALRAERAELAKQSRITTVSELAAGLAHELNQPLAAIGHYCDAALSVARSASENELAEIIQQAYEQTQRAGEIIRNLRTLIGDRTTEKTSEDLNALITVTTRFLMAEIRSNKTTLELSLAKNLPRVLVNKVEIQQVLTNLILNSLEAMELAESPLRRITVASDRGDNEVRLTVRDTGPGVDDEIESQLYAPFQSGKPEGLGLGLWICQSIITSHHGHLWTEASPEGGATFHFTLPLTSE